MYSNWSYSAETPNFRSKLAIFLSCVTLKFDGDLVNNWAPLLCHTKLCASYHLHKWIQTSYSPETAKWAFDLCTLALCPLTLTFCMDITFVNGNNSRKYYDDTMTRTLWKRCDRQTDGRTDGLKCSYSCLVAAKKKYVKWKCHFCTKSLGVRCSLIFVMHISRNSWSHEFLLSTHSITYNICLIIPNIAQPRTVPWSHLQTG